MELFGIIVLGALVWLAFYPVRRYLWNYGGEPKESREETLKGHQERYEKQRQRRLSR